MEPSHGSRSFQHDRPVAVIDLETTGTDINRDRVVQVAVLTLNADGSEAEFESLVNPGIEIPAAATRVHGIASADVQGKPTFHDLAPALLKLLSGCDLVGCPDLAFGTRPAVLLVFRRLPCFLLDFWAGGVQNLA
jgi:DNA polymerase-3 subunit epsilon